MVRTDRGLRLRFSYGGEVRYTAHILLSYRLKPARRRGILRNLLSVEGEIDGNLILDTRVVKFLVAVVVAPIQAGPLPFSYIGTRTERSLKSCNQCAIQCFSSSVPEFHSLYISLEFLLSLRRYWPSPAEATMINDSVYLQSRIRER